MLVERGLNRIGLFLVASPSLGSDYANMLGLLSSVMGHTQASALRFSQSNVWLNDLDKDFINLKGNKDLQIKGKELIEDLPLYGKGFIKKQIVEPFSGAKYFGNSFKVPGSDHSTIATPANKDAVQHRLLVQFIKEFLQEEILTPKPDRSLKGQTEKQVINNDLRNAQFNGGLINADTVSVGQMGGNVYNIHFGQQQATSGNTPSSPQRKERSPTAGRSSSPQERDSLEKVYTLQSQKVDRLRNAWVIETDPSRKFQYEQQLQTEERTLRELGDKLDAMEQQLQTTEKPRVEAEKDIYIERPPIEDKCYNAIVQPGALIRIKAPQRMGKSLLLEKILDYARKQSYETIKLDLKLADNSTLIDLKTFLHWLCVNVSDRLNLEDKTEEYWQDNLGINTGCTRYFQRYILSNINTNLVFAIDNFERLFEHDNIFSEFYLLLRSWYETAKQGDRMGKIWKKLRLIVVNSTEVYPTLDINRSPFNVGVAVELPEFNQQQIQEMIRLYGLDHLFSQEGLEQLISLIGGHPYLVQEVISQLKEQEVSLQELLTLAPTEQGIFSYHLRQQLEALEKDAQLKESYKRVITADQAVQLSPEVTFKLHSLGLVKIVRNDCVASCDLYRQYFLARLR
ncbi:AAA-like domain-containing protein [Anabaena sp. CCY 9910]|uniref:AAA-like domain-containing protein n=1 Tax=Anabaena sp. CCY 9910 TaxID=3103870 RepID=UPI0039E031B1